MLNTSYAYYQGTYGGDTIPTADFDRVMRQAFAHVRRATRGRAERPQRDHVQARIDDACCAVAEILYKEMQGPEVASESVGKWSRSFAVGKETVRRRVQSTIKLYLSGTGLTYKGVM